MIDVENKPAMAVTTMHVKRRSVLTDCIIYVVDRELHLSSTSHVASEDPCSDFDGSRSHPDGIGTVRNGSRMTFPVPTCGAVCTTYDRAPHRLRNGVSAY